MLFLLLAALVTIAQAPADAPTPTPQVKPKFDALGTALASRAIIRQDKRCSQGADETDAFVKSNGTDVEAGLRAMVLLEKCSILGRVEPQSGPAASDWAEYTDYINTAAAAIAYQLGFITGEPRAYVRAAFDASRVRGFAAPTSVTTQTYGNTPTAGVLNGTVPFNDPIYSGAQGGLQEIYNGFPMENSERYRYSARTHHSSGFAGPYGQEATDIAAAAVDALETIVRSARPQATPVPK